MARIRVGISGWTYKYWRGDFYPQGLVQRREFAYAAARFDTLELNASFYSLQRPTSYRRWADELGDDTTLAVKGSKYVTHIRKLRDAQTALANFYASGVIAVGAHLGPFLWQLPETHVADPQVLADFFRLLPRTTGEAAALAARHDDKIAQDRTITTADVDVPLRHALEARNDSFADPAVLDVLAEHDIACVVADTGGRFPFLDRVTSDHVYVRLHGPEGLYDSGYTDEGLDAWADRFRGWRDAGLDVNVYFDNDGHCHAPWDALRLKERLADG